MNRILFRADADPVVGTGDLSSLITLSAQFDRGRWESHFMVRRHAFAEGIVDSRGIERVLWLNPDISIEYEVVAVNRAVEEWGFAAVLFEITRDRLDSYRGLTSRAVKACICFDSNVPVDFDVIVNWDVNSSELFEGKKFEKAELLLGPQYVLLPVEFDPKRINERVHPETISSVLVAMGGADEHDLTGEACRALAGMNKDLSLRVVLGVGYRYEENLLETFRATRMRSLVERNVSDMFSRYMGCDFAVGTGGLTVSELAASRTRAAVVAAYKHQVARCEYFARLGAVRYLGFRRVDRVGLESAMAEPYTFVPYGFFRPHVVCEAVERALLRRGR